MNEVGELWKRVVGGFFFDDFFYNGDGGIVDKYQKIAYYLRKLQTSGNTTREFLGLRM